MPAQALAFSLLRLPTCTYRLRLSPAARTGKAFCSRGSLIRVVRAAPDQSLSDRKPLDKASSTEPRTQLCAQITASLQSSPAATERSDEAAEVSADKSNDSEVTTLPPPSFVKVKSAEFIKSSPSLSQCPPAKYPEFAVIGRSNVGKSTLVNLLTGRKSLALVSKTPGKTQLINHFLINKSWYLVDLPGYGYAKTAKTNRVVWNEFTKDYFLNRPTLANVLLLIDSSIPPQQVDLDCANWLGDAQVPFTLVFTKTDKRKKQAPSPQENIKAFTDTLLKEWSMLPRVLATSAKTGDGAKDVLVYLSQLRELFNQHKDE